MWPGFEFLGLKVSVFGIGMAVSFVMLNFWIWREARREYPEEEVITMTIILTILGLVGFAMWRWTSIGGVLALEILGLKLWAQRHKWDFWEWLDLIGRLSLRWGILVSLAWGPDTWPGSLSLLVGAILVETIRRYYRRFSWYKSGKLGFVGLSSILVWLVSWMLIAKWQTSNVYLGGLRLEIWIAIWAIVGSLIAIYLRGGRKTSHDLRIFSKLWPTKNKKLH